MTKDEIKAVIARAEEELDTLKGALAHGTIDDSNEIARLNARQAELENKIAEMRARLEEA